MTPRAKTGDIDTKVNRGIAWVGVASSLVGLLDLIAFVIILRTGWITAAELGVATLATSLFPVLDLATDLGLSGAVIQRDDHSREKISTVFWLNVAMSLVLCTVVGFGLGPFLAWFHHEPVLTALFLAYSGKLLFQNVYFIPYALMRRALRFKELSVLRIVANLGEFAAKIGFAAGGLGVWAFVLGPLARVVITGAGTQILHPWKPAMVLRWHEAREWIGFGFRTSGSKILFNLYSNLDYQVVKYFFGAAALGVYRAAFEMVLTPAMVISEIITQVAFPLFSRIKDDMNRLVDQLVTFTRMNLVVMIAFIGVIFVATEPAFALLAKHSLWGGLHQLPGVAVVFPALGSAWLRFPAADWSAGVPVARILCFVALLRALSFLVPPLLDGIGRPNLTLRYSIVAAVVVPASFVLSAYLFGDRLGAISVALAWAVSYPIAFAFLFAMTFAALDLRPGAFLRRIVGIPLCGLVALGVAEVVHAFDAGLPGLVRFAIAAAMMIGVFGLLLARFQGMSLAAVARALRGT